MTATGWISNKFRANKKNADTIYDGDDRPMSYVLPLPPIFSPSTVRYGTVRYNTEPSRTGTVPYHTIPYGTVRYSAVPCIF